MFTGIFWMRLFEFATLVFTLMSMVEDTKKDFNEGDGKGAIFDLIMYPLAIWAQVSILIYLSK